MMTSAAADTNTPHIPVLIRPLIAAVSPVSGVWLDGTFGAGGYTKALLEAGADKVIGVDRDPLAFEMADPWVQSYGDRIELVEGVFSKLDDYASDLDGIVLDLGVSSMQLDLAERGFSFMRDGPLDMRMSQDGRSAADICNDADEAEIADIIYLYGEERASRRIAKAIVNRPFNTTTELAYAIGGAFPPKARRGRIHPATRTFQALRIAVNNEYGELAEGLMAAERALKPGGQLAVVTFHSVEDRMVKRFLQARGGGMANANRYAPATEEIAAAFTVTKRKAIGPDDQELSENPRSRSAKLRVATRTDAPAVDVDPADLGMPIKKKGKR